MIATLGTRPVSAITPALISEALAPIWQTKTVTAKRVKNRIERVCKWVEADMPLPAPRRTVEHHKALPYDDMEKFMRKLRACDGIDARALEFLVLQAATWDEIDLENGIWTIQAGRKGAKTLGKTRRNPLQGRSLDILKALPRERENPHVFIGLGKDAIAERLKALGYTSDQAVVHDFRSTFATWCEECTNYPDIVSEAQLWHVKADKVTAAYKRGDIFEKRKRLLRDWETFCSGVAKSGKFAVLHGAA